MALGRGLNSGWSIIKKTSAFKDGMREMASQGVTSFLPALLPGLLVATFIFTLIWLSDIKPCLGLSNTLWSNRVTGRGG